MDVELKTCPFCRGQSYAEGPAYGRAYWYVFCDDCGAEGPPASRSRYPDLTEEGLEQQAIAAWNRRDGQGGTDGRA